MRGLAVALALLLVGAMPDGGTAAMAGNERAQRAAATDLSSQNGSPARARTRITVRPASRLVRECDFWLAREVRPSGTYVVPRQRCWWARRR